MPILLDTPFSFDPGHGFPTEVYTHVNLKRMLVEHELGYIDIWFDYGTYDGPKWTKGKADTQLVRIIDQDPVVGFNEATQQHEATAPITDFTDMIVTNYGIWAGAGTVLYQYAMDLGLYVGTIVPDHT